MNSPKRKRRRILLIIGLFVVAVILLIISSQVCMSAYLFQGVLTRTCPDGHMRQTLYADAWGLHRGAEGTVRIGAVANFTTKEADSVQMSPVRRFKLDLALVRPKGDPTPLTPEKGWKDDSDHSKMGAIKLPDVPDGDYTLRARVKSSLGEDTLDVALPIYSPAKIHVITDRPLYQPGNTVQFRAVVLRARDLAPLDGRPGVWMVVDPTNETVFEEKSPAGEFGVASGSFPLDEGAPTGDWHVRWVSGGSQDDVAFRVEPFTLPRFRLEASARKPFYRAHDSPAVDGKVIYSSGAPVANAEIEIAWSVNGAWPPPLAWTSGRDGSPDSLPKHATADAAGNFHLTLPKIPKDLKGKATLFGAISAVDAAGDRVDGSVALLLSEDAIDVQPVTELEEGLVQGFNNRLYLRASTASGGVLSKTRLLVKRGWQPSDKGIETLTDEDGVASIQIDPGPPVNVVIPPMPARPLPRPPAVSRTSAGDLLANAQASLADQRALDGFNHDLAGCARFLEGSQDTITIGVRVDAKGAIEDMASDPRPLAACAKSALKGKKLTPGKERVLELSYVFNSDMPRIVVSAAGAPNVPPTLQGALSVAALDARTCLPDEIESSPMRGALIFSASVKKGEVKAAFAPDPLGKESTVKDATERCIEDKLKAIHLPKQSEEGDEGTHAVGVVHFNIQASQRMEQARPQATTMLGYELKIEAGTEKEAIGSTKVILRPGTVPAIRLRAQPVLAEAGQDVDVTLIRGPSFSGQLPDKLYLVHERGSIESKIDAKTRSARFKLPADAKGWFSSEWGGGHAYVYVRPKGELRIEVSPKKQEYAPGEEAELAISTTAQDKGTKAAVGLIGVDQSLGQLVPLPGPNSMARIRPKATMSSPAFGVLDAEALAMGRIRGENAAAATILRVVAIPPPPEVDASINASAHPSFEPLEALTDHFYLVLAELYQEERKWEERAPKDEQMAPKTMAKLWAAALEDCDKKKVEATDAYGRKLRLHRLPADLLALTDPRHVVVNGTRLPEDIENWTQWVMKEQP